MAQGQVRCLLLCKTSLIPVRIHHFPLCAPSITLCNTLLHSSTYCIILWLVVYVSDSLARLAPLGLEQCLIQCKSPSVSIGPGTTKMPNTCCGFIIYGPGGHHAGRCKVCGDHIVENVYCCYHPSTPSRVISPLMSSRGEHLGLVQKAIVSRKWSGI